jgi:hypothetical protein
MAYVFSKPSGDPPVGGARVGDGLLVENGQKPGAGVFGVHVDGARAQRAECDLRGPQPRSAIDGETRILHHLREHLRQQVRLGERLGRHHHRLLCADHQQQSEHGVHPAAVSSRRRT